MNSMRYEPCVSSLSHHQDQASLALVSLIVVLLVALSLIVGLLG